MIIWAIFHRLVKIDNFFYWNFTFRQSVSFECYFCVYFLRKMSVLFSDYISVFETIDISCLWGPKSGARIVFLGQFSRAGLFGCSKKLIEKLSSWWKRHLKKTRFFMWILVISWKSTLFGLFLEISWLKEYRKTGNLSFGWDLGSKMAKIGFFRVFGPFWSGNLNSLLYHGATFFGRNWKKRDFCDFSLSDFFSDPFSN